MIRCVPKLAAPIESDIGREFASDFVPKAQAKHDIIETTLDAEIRGITERQVEFEPWLGNETLGDE